MEILFKRWMVAYHQKVGLMKRLFFLLLLLSSPVLAEEYTIYTTERPPSSWSGIIDSEGYYYWFTNAGDA